MKIRIMTIILVESKNKNSKLIFQFLISVLNQHNLIVFYSFNDFVLNNSKMIYVILYALKLFKNTIT